MAFFSSPATSFISTMKVDCPEERSSLAPMRVNTRSTLSLIHIYSRPAHGRGVSPHFDEELHPQLLAQRLDDGADEQGAEQALGHGPQGVDAIPLGRDLNVFAL